MVTIEDAERHKLTLSMDFSYRYNRSVSLSGVKNCIFNLAKFNPKAIELDLVVFTAETSGEVLLVCISEDDIAALTLDYHRLSNVLDLLSDTVPLR